jgi:threonine synthase
MHVLAKMEGISAEPAAATAFAGAFSKWCVRGLCAPTDTVVVNCTGHTMPTEEEVLGDEWVHDVALPAQQAAAAPPQEGLLAALNQVVPQTLPRASSLWMTMRMHGA